MKVPFSQMMQISGVYVIYAMNWFGLDDENHPKFWSGCKIFPFSAFYTIGDNQAAESINGSFADPLQGKSSIVVNESLLGSYINFTRTRIWGGDIQHEDIEKFELKMDPNGLFRGMIFDQSGKECIGVAQCRTTEVPSDTFELSEKVLAVVAGLPIKME